MAIYGDWLLNGSGVEKDEKEAAKVSENGSIAYLCSNACNGQWVAKSLKEALKYNKMAADMGIVESMFSYAYMMSQWFGAPIHNEEAVEYFKKAADFWPLWINEKLVNFTARRNRNNCRSYRSCKISKNGCGRWPFWFKECNLYSENVILVKIHRIQRENYINLNLPI